MLYVNALVINIMGVCCVWVGCLHMYGIMCVCMGDYVPVDAGVHKGCPCVTRRQCVLSLHIYPSWVLFH